MLSTEQVGAVRRILREPHSRIIGQYFGAEFLTSPEIEELERAGIDVEAAGPDILTLAFVRGRLSAGSEIAEPADLGDNHLNQIAALKTVGASRVRGLGDKVLAEASEVIRNTVAPDRPVGSIRSLLGRELKDWQQNLERLIYTEKHNANQLGVASAIEEKGGDPQVFKRPSPDACESCMRLYLQADRVTPRVYRLADMAPSNAGLKRSDWRPTIGVTHPLCTCELFEVPPGWGFDEEGTLLPGLPEPVTERL